MSKMAKAAAVLGCLALMALAAAGCGRKAEPSAPGYYAGPMQSKDLGVKAKAPPVRS